MNIENPVSLPADAPRDMGIVVDSISSRAFTTNGEPAREETRGGNEVMGGDMGMGTFEHSGEEDLAPVSAPGRILALLKDEKKPFLLGAS